MIDIAPLYRECLALMTIKQLEEAEKILWTGDNPASRKVVAEIQAEKSKRIKKLSLLKLEKTHIYDRIKVSHIRGCLHGFDKMSRMCKRNQ